MTTTTLASDLRNCSMNGVVIGAPNITLDLGGHRIDGVGMGNGVDNEQGHKGVTIKNGRIRGFQNGVSLKNATQNRLRELVVSNNNEGIFLLNSDDNRIEKNTTSNNDTTGITLNGGSDNNLVDQNLSFDNENFGIAVENSMGNRIRKNQANNNGFLNGMAGIMSDGASTGTMIENNVANSNKTDGISVGNVTMTKVKGNTANNNNQWGINVVALGTDGGGNKARGNVQAAQCNNVTC